MIHNIRYRLFVYGDEDEEELLQGLKTILPSAKTENEIAEGMLDDKIKILSGRIEKKKDTKEFLKSLLEMDQESLINLVNDLEKKIDEHGNLFLRFSKPAATNDEWEICDSGDSIHLKIKIAAYPAKKEIAINLLNDALELHNSV